MILHLKKQTKQTLIQEFTYLLFTNIETKKRLVRKKIVS